MAREVQIMTWCDHCLAADNAQIPGAEYIGLNSDGLRVIIDLCDECTAAFITPALSVLDAYGRNEPKVRKQKKSAPVEKPGVPCDQPGCERVLGSVQALGMHKHRSHGIASPNRSKGKAA